MENKAFCITCNKITEYITKEEEMFGKVTGKYYSFMGERAYCTVCGNRIMFPEEVSERNLDKLYKVVGERKNDEGRI